MSNFEIVISFLYFVQDRAKHWHIHICNRMIVCLVACGLNVSSCKRLLNSEMMIYDIQDPFFNLSKTWWLVLTALQNISCQPSGLLSGTMLFWFSYRCSLGWSLRRCSNTDCLQVQEDQRVHATWNSNFWSQGVVTWLVFYFFLSFETEIHSRACSIIFLE